MNKIIIEVLCIALLGGAVIYFIVRAAMPPKSEPTSADAIEKQIVNIQNEIAKIEAMMPTEIEKAQAVLDKLKTELERLKTLKDKFKS